MGNFERKISHFQGLPPVTSLLFLSQEGSWTFLFLSLSIPYFFDLSLSHNILSVLSPPLEPTSFIFNVLSCSSHKLYKESKHHLLFYLTPLFGVFSSLSSAMAAASSSRRTPNMVSSCILHNIKEDGVWKPLTFKILDWVLMKPSHTGPHKVKRKNRNLPQYQWKGRIMEFKVGSDGQWLAKVQHVYTAKEMKLEVSLHSRPHCKWCHVPKLMISFRVVFFNYALFTLYRCLSLIPLWMATGRIIYWYFSSFTWRLWKVIVSE